ncbi:hypothetical protein A11A3_14170 [Alcanivorax hongdengensis A-11-3]|jgi:hypothetical protein|uniref:Uncharacterized protein n=1 Tax=Alcanivorax hongdengensis A-11-3 TaxID=1177179 RepID=L0WB43_9GAMM|nr:hypothetical protein [Alcanivorax hongdengensis]EKF73317.1 hypothetical protein A11A3_14170 [Alcanivorax hongdengensis A-11-3]KYZ86243.1 hypothetical protein A3Q32_03460 [Alcanivorax sp. KX64203]|tara:strand:+ start:315 stop:707 length:393 start_codon:yes stop_codon:yes gene_type:complete
MHTMNNQAMLEQIAISDHHFSQAPEAFFRAWKRGVQLLSPTLFGLGTKAHVDQAEDKWELCPNLEVIDQAIGVMSSGERVFLAAMVSFYNANIGGVLLKRVGVHGLSDLGGLDLEHRQVIADLVLNYTGW